MTGLTLLFHLVFIIAPFGVLVSAQTCGNDIFAIANPQGEIQLQITADGTFTACNGTDLCSTLSQSTQQLTLENGLLSISNGNAVFLPDLSSTNELQNLSVNSATNELTIENGNTVTINTSATNELQTLTFQNGILSISQGNGISLPDISSTNEIQTLSVNPSTNQLTIQNGNTVTIDTSATNELQSLLLNGNELSISDKNSVTLPQAKTAFASGPGSNPTYSRTFLSTTVNVTTTETQRNIFVVATHAFGSTVGVNGLWLCICYQAPGSASLPTSVGDCLYYLSVPGGVRVPMTLSAVFERPAGTWTVGLCGNVLADPYVWNSQDWGYVTAVVL